MGASSHDGAHRELEGAAWDVGILVFDTDGVHTHFLGHKFDAVVTVIERHDVTQLCHTLRAGHGGSQVKRTGS